MLVSLLKRTIPLLLLSLPLWGQTKIDPATQIKVGTFSNGMTAVTQPFGDNTTKLATDAFVMANVSGKPNTGALYATDYGVVGGAIVYCDAAWINGQNIITVGNAGNTGGIPKLPEPPFTSAMVGWKVFGTNWACQSGSNQSSVLQIPLGTITQIDSTIQIKVSGNATATCTSTPSFDACTLIIGPVDDTAALQAAWSDTVQKCTKLILPATNMLFSHGILWPENPGSSSGVNQCGTGGAAANSFTAPGGPVVEGQGMYNTILIPLPGFDANTCDIGVSNYGDRSCLFANRGLDADANSTFIDFGVFGGGVLTVANSASHNVMQLGDGARAQRVMIAGWGLDDGFRMYGNFNATVLSDSLLSYAGNLENVFTNSANGFTAITNNVFFGGKGVNINIQGNTLGIGAVLTGNEIWGGATAGVKVTSPATATIQGDYFTICGAICLDITGTAHLSAVRFGVGGASVAEIQIENGGTGYFSNIQMLGGLVGVKVLSGGTGYDLGGNNFGTATSPYSISGSWFGSSSVTGIADTTTNWVLASNWGSSVIASAAGDSHRSKVSITGAAGAANPVLTWTFPKSFAVAPVSCSLLQVSGTFGVLTNAVVGPITTTGVTFTFSGTPAAQTYTFDISCGSQ